MTLSAALRAAGPASKPTAASEPAGRTHGNLLGIQPGLASDQKAYDGLVADVQTFGVTWVRVYWNWGWAEGKKGRLNLAPLKVVATAAHRRGMKVIMLATGAPAWANGGRAQDYPPTDDHVSDFAAYAAAVAKETDADAVEVWNEPNNRSFWLPAPDPARMARLQVAAYRAVKTARPETVVITGGLTEVEPDATSFFAEMIAADPEFVNSFDAVGLHPYNEPTDPLVPGASGMKNMMTVQTPAIHQMLVDHGRAGVPVWFTEYGVATHGRWSVGEADQAVYLSHFFDGVAALRGRGIDVGVCVLYTLRDGQDYRGDDDQPFFGLLRHDGTEKPAAATVRTFAKAAG